MRKWAVLVAVLAGLAALHPGRRLITHMEIMDAEWCPAVLRRFQQDSLHGGWKITFDGPLPPLGGSDFVDLLTTAYSKSHSTQILELASGGGGPSPILAAMMEKKLRTTDPNAQVRVRMSDLFPNVEGWERIAKNNTRISFVKEPVDALKVPKKYSEGSFRLIVGAFHHFPPELAQDLISDAVRAKTGIAIVDGTSSLLVSFLLPINGVFHHFLQLYSDFSVLNLFLFPVFLAAHIHDGFVSSLRMYGRIEMEEMCKKADPKGEFEWSIRGYPAMFPIMQVTVGNPR